MDVNALNKTVLGIQQSLDSSRIGLKEDVFLERHLPTIMKDGKPTVAMSIELSKLAGGENKRLNIVDDNGKVVLTLPSALSSGNTINNKDLKENTKAIQNINGIDGDNLTDKALNKFNSKIEDIKDKHINDLKTDWTYVIDHYKDKVKPIVTPEVSTKPKNNLRKNITFEY